MLRRAMGLVLGGPLWIVAVLALASLPGLAQTQPSAVLTIDPERLFQETQFGGRVLAETEALADALQAENRRIESELIAEERDLTDKRPDLPVEEFRTLADAFDAKVERIRNEQDEKARGIQDRRESGRQDFIARIGPVLLEIVRERKAAILLDRRTVFLSAESVDITDEAIARVDAEIGAGPPSIPAPPDGASTGTGEGGSDGGQ